MTNLMKEKIEEILLVHILTGELKTNAFVVEEHEEILEIYYNNSILLRTFIPINSSRCIKMVTYSSKIELPGRIFYNNRVKFLDDIKKISKILNNF